MATRLYPKINAVNIAIVIDPKKTWPSVKTTPPIKKTLLENVVYFNKTQSYNK